jgi:hypothetical protein
MCLTLPPLSRRAENAIRAAPNQACFCDGCHGPRMSTTYRTTTTPTHRTGVLSQSCASIAQCRRSPSDASRGRPRTKKNDFRLLGTPGLHLPSPIAYQMRPLVGARCREKNVSPCGIRETCMGGSRGVGEEVAETAGYILRASRESSPRPWKKGCLLRSFSL